MNMFEFNDAYAQVEPILRQFAPHKPYDQNVVADLFIKAAIHQIALISMDSFEGTIPQPICKMCFVPGNGDGGVNTYAVPVDQI